MTNQTPEEREQQARECPFCGDPMRFDARDQVWTHSEDGEGCIASGLQPQDADDLACWNTRALAPLPPSVPVAGELARDLEAAALLCYQVHGPQSDLGGRLEAHRTALIPHREQAPSPPAEGVVEALAGFIAELTNGGRNADNTLSINHDRLCQHVKRARQALEHAATRGGE